MIKNKTYYNENNILAARYRLCFNFHQVYRNQGNTFSLSFSSKIRIQGLQTPFQYLTSSLTVEESTNVYFWEIYYQNRWRHSFVKI